MATRLSPDDQMERLRSYPHIGTDELIRFFTLTPADVAFADPGRARGPVDRLGLAVQLRTMPWLGFVPDDVRPAPPVAVARLAGRLGLDPEVPARYGNARRPARIICGWSATTGVEERARRRGGADGGGSRPSR